MPKLNVNIDHVATIRQARRGSEPDPVAAAIIAELAGASGIVLHLREDRRHVQERDLEILRKVVQTKLNMEMAPTHEMKEIIKRVKPDMVTLVPENREEITTEGGLDVIGNKEFLKSFILEIRKENIFVSFFIDPDLLQIDAAIEVGTQMVEIHTGSYAEAKDENEKKKELSNIREAVEFSVSRGLRVSAGHGLNYQNVKEIAKIKGIEELNIGHSIISRAVLVGMEKAVRDMISLCGGE